MSTEKKISFSLMQWNTLSFHLSDKKAFPYAKDEDLKWENRLPLLKNYLEENKPDIICMEEIGNFDSGFKSDIIDKLTIKYDIAFGQRSAPTLNIKLGSIIGVNKEVFTMEKYESVVLEDEEGKPGGQNMIWALIVDKKSGNKFIVFVVHLKAKEPNENIRIGQVNHLIKFIENNFLRKYPIFILGDFNAEPSYTCINNLLSNENLNVKSLFDLNKLDYSTIKLREKLYKRIIDYILFVSKNKNNSDNELCIRSAERAKPELDESIGLPNDKFPSDHLFLKAEVDLKFC